MSGQRGPEPEATPGSMGKALIGCGESPAPAELCPWQREVRGAAAAPSPCSGCLPL